MHIHNLFTEYANEEHKDQKVIPEESKLTVGKNVFVLTFLTCLHSPLI